MRAAAKSPPACSSLPRYDTGLENQGIRDRPGPPTRTHYGGTHMKLWWRLAVAGLAAAWLWGFVSAARPSAQAQMTAPIQGKKAGEYFKNVSTTTLKELSVDDFIFAMGVIADDLGLDCADCHPGAGTDQVN